MDIEEFALGNSFVHNLDPRVKIVCALIFSTVVAVNHWIPAAALAIVFPMVLIVAARINALSHMGIPDKLVHIFFFCFRYIHVIHEEYHRLAKAMKIRSFQARSDIHTYRTYAYLVG